MLLLLGIIVLVFGGMNQYAGWKERHKKGFSTLGNESMEAMLRQWLDKRGYFSNHQTSEKDLFRFVVTDDQKRPVNINRPKNNPTVIRLLLALSEDDLSKIPAEQQIILRFRIGVEMARFGLLCHPNKPMYVHLDLPCDDLLAESVFLNALDKIRQAHVLMAANVQAVLATSKIPIPAIEQVPDKEDSQKQ